MERRARDRERGREDGFGERKNRSRTDPYRMQTYLDDYNNDYYDEDYDDEDDYFAASHSKYYGYEDDYYYDDDYVYNDHDVDPLDDDDDYYY